MSTNRTSGAVVIVAGLWSAALPPTMGQSPECLPWEQKHPAHSPSPRDGHMMAYDSTRGVTVLFGGISGTHPNYVYNKDTWEWDGHDWVERSASGPAPASKAAMVYDELRGVTVLVGGEGSVGVGGTWEWDGVRWTLRSNSGPSHRHSHAMAYDSDRGVTVLFGSRFQSGETWEWDGLAWELRSSTGPAPRWDHAMAYDSRRHVTVLYGGVYGSSETWEWDGRVWVRRTAFVGPELRMAHSMAYDSLRGATLLFSGLGTDSRAALQTWEWDGVAWTLFSETGPPARLYSAMAYDSARRVTVLFAGVLAGALAVNDTWELASCPRDSDGDGVPDPDDECDISDLRSTIVIAGCDSGVGNHLFDDGCTMADRIGECAEGARNHKAFERCVKHLTKEWVREDLISKQERRAIRRCADRADDDDDNDDDGEDEDGHDRHARPTKGASTLSVETLGRR